MQILVKAHTGGVTNEAFTLFTKREGFNRFKHSCRSQIRHLEASIHSTLRGAALKKCFV